MLNFVSSGRPYSPKLKQEQAQKQKRSLPPGVNEPFREVTIQSKGKLYDTRTSINIDTNPFLSPLLNNRNPKVPVDTTKSPFFNQAPKGAGSHTITPTFSSMPDSKVTSNPKKGVVIYSPLEKLSEGSKKHITIY